MEPFTDALLVLIAAPVVLALIGLDAATRGPWLAALSRSCRVGEAGS